MSLKWIGTAVILIGCGGLGFKMAWSHRRRSTELQQLLHVLDVLADELRCRLTPLPELSLIAANAVSGDMGLLFRKLHTELERQISPDAACCMNAALSASTLSPAVQDLLRALGHTLGRFDLDGQLHGMNAVRYEAAQILDKLAQGQEARLRSYQTLGLCAGAALAILLL